MIKIVAINTSYVQTMIAPYYLKVNSGDICEEIEILQTSTKVASEDIVAMIGECDIVGFCCYIFNINHVRAVARRLKECYPNVIIIYGGPEIENVSDSHVDAQGNSSVNSVSTSTNNAVSECSDIIDNCATNINKVSIDSSMRDGTNVDNNPAEQYNEADYVMLGEGDFAFGELVRAIRACDNVGRIVRSTMPELRLITAPYSEYIKDVVGKIAYFESSRGCPYSCAYCMSGKSRLRNFPLEYVFCELERLRCTDIRVLKFVDRTFNADSSRACKIMKYIIDNSGYYNYTFHFEIAADILTDEFMSVVESAPSGLFQFEIGVQSFNIKTLAAVIRKCDIDKIKRNIVRLTSSGKCHIHTDLIAGLPHEGLESFASSFDSLYALGGDMLQVGTLKLLHGSKLESMVSAEGGWSFDINAPYEVINTPAMSASDIAVVKSVDWSVDKFYNSGMLRHTLKRYVDSSYWGFYRGLAASSDSSSHNIDVYDIIFSYLVSMGNDRNAVQGYVVRDYIERNSALPKSGKIANEYDPEFKQMLRKYQYNRQSAYEFELKYNPFDNISERIVIVGYHQYSDKFYYKILYIDRGNQ